VSETSSLAFQFMQIMMMTLLHSFVEIFLKYVDHGLDEVNFETINQRVVSKF